MNNQSVFIGYSDDHLEKLCKLSSRFESGIAPWASVESEISSFGKTFREWAFFPSWLPLYICSDHGVQNMTRCWPNETNSPFRYFFTWNKKKSEIMKFKYGKKALHVPHPWVAYRKKHFNKTNKNRVGTLVFFPHSNHTAKVIVPDLDSYINDLKLLPEKFKPLVLCLSSFEIQNGLHLKFRSFGLPIVTVGEISSQKFVDRFYSLIYQFRYTTSPDVGSHTYYALEAGIPFFLYGPTLETHIQSTGEIKSFLPDGIAGWNEYGDEEDLIIFNYIKKNLNDPIDHVTDRQLSIANEYLGLNSPVSSGQVALIFWTELFLHLDILLSTYYSRAKNIVYRLFTYLLKM